MSHYDYVKLPDGRRKRISSPEDIDAVLAEWGDYIEKNWITPQRGLFDPESKVKFMLEGLGNIILRPNMSGMLTEYQKMKIEKYEIPISACGSLFDDEMYSRRSKKDNGEGLQALEAHMEETARKFDEAKAGKLKNQPPKKQPKQFPPTRRQKLLAAEKRFSFKAAHWVRVDTENVFHFGGNYYQIPADCAAYASRVLRDGDLLYDMDQILCAEAGDGVMFFDMNIEPVDGVRLIGEQIKFC